MFMNLLGKSIDRAINQTIEERDLSDRTAIYWLLLCWNVSMTLFALVSNLAVLIFLSRDKKRLYLNSFYQIIRQFVLIMVIDCSFSLLLKFRSEILRLKCIYLSEYTMLIDLFVSYYSTILIFLLGLNRISVFTFKFIKKRMFSRRGIRYSLRILSISTILMSCIIARFAEMRRDYDLSNGIIRDECGSALFVTIISYVFYTFPLISSFFYLIVFYSLRNHRKDVVSEQTRILLTKAEKNTFQQGSFILISYLGSLMTHLSLQLLPPSYLSFPFFFRLEEFVSRLPQLALPLSILLCNVEMQRHVLLTTPVSLIIRSFRISDSPRLIS